MKPARTKMQERTVGEQGLMDTVPHIGTAPDFLIIGAAKAGTTSLHHYFDAHPGIHMSKVKETRYFSAIGLPPSRWLNGHGRLFFDIPQKAEAYCAMFSGAAPGALLGEACPDYLASSIASNAIAETLPDVKLIAILRHPVERAYSNWSYRAGLGTEDGTFGQAIEEDLSGQRDTWISGRIVHEGFYHAHLTRYLAHFPVEHLKVVLYEDLVTDGATLVSELFRFLGVDPKVQTDTDTVHNPRSSQIVSRRPGRLAARLGSVTKLRRLASHLPPGLKDRLRGRQAPVAPMSAGERQHLLALYRDDTLALQEMLGRDLSAWMR
ncbi:sulfotransferase domain-containing protein [Acidimangrovimonas sediminis]|uniref:sulfotransferase domain-containing protein n=1 Tax=Acidimangrovimonas sediminis TaxID=2056283 RepID=UPI000C7FCF7C|nr:sulfotransferase domain-containing protein [Acidimangrovimonas sediminis]